MGLSPAAEIEVVEDTYSVSNRQQPTLKGICIAPIASRHPLWDDVRNGYNDTSMRERYCTVWPNWILKLPHFYLWTTFNTLIHSSLHRSRSFPSTPTLNAKLSNISNTPNFLRCFYYTLFNRALELALLKRKIFHIPISCQWSNTHFFGLSIIKYQHLKNGKQ